VAIASLCVNLFLVTFLAVAIMRYTHALSGGGRVTADSATETLFQQLPRKLPPADARILRDAFAAKSQTLLHLKRQTALASERVRADIARQPFDIDLLRADLIKAREVRRQYGPLIEDALLEALPKMSQQGRTALSQATVMAQR
jgi:uncharacterized membrane protein